MNDIKESSKRGYLNNDFEFFHIRDRKNIQFDFHYHDFNKIIVFISGTVTYLIEGKAYKLKPWDILIVSNNEVHKPIIDPKETYERIVLWINAAFLQKHNTADCNLLTCFDTAAANGCNLLRPDPESNRLMRSILSHLEDAHKNKDGFGSRVLKNSLFIQFIVHMNCLFLQMDSLERNLMDIEFDESISAVIHYVNENLAEELSIESLSTRFFMSKYYLMHKFKAQTGYSLHNYILQKRLIMANALIKKGKPITEVSIECGFRDYSSFVRAFKKMFGASPKQHYKNMLKLQKEYGSGHL